MHNQHFTASSVIWYEELGGSISPYGSAEEALCLSRYVIVGNLLAQYIYNLHISVTLNMAAAKMLPITAWKSL